MTFNSEGKDIGRKMVGREISKPGGANSEEIFLPKIFLPPLRSLSCRILASREDFSQVSWPQKTRIRRRQAKAVGTAEIRRTQSKPPLRSQRLRRAQLMPFSALR